MTLAVVFSKKFRQDLLRHIEHASREDIATKLLEEIESLAIRLANHSSIGALQNEETQMRHMVLRRVPFIVWYRIEQRTKRVVVVRLFHGRQQRAL